jgi:hypothetical protein
VRIAARARAARFSDLVSSSPVPCGRLDSVRELCGLRLRFLVLGYAAIMHGRNDEKVVLR